MVDSNGVPLSNEDYIRFGRGLDLSNTGTTRGMEHEAVGAAGRDWMNGRGDASVSIALGGGGGDFDSGTAAAQGIIGAATRNLNKLSGYFRQFGEQALAAFSESDTGALNQLVGAIAAQRSALERAGVASLNNVAALDRAALFVQGLAQNAGQITREAAAAAAREAVRAEREADRAERERERQALAGAVEAGFMRANRNGFVQGNSASAEADRVNRANDRFEGSDRRA